MGRLIIFVGFVASVISIYVFVSGHQSLGEIVAGRRDIVWEVRDNSGVWNILPDRQSGFTKPGPFFYIQTDTSSLTSYASDIKQGFRPAVVKSTSWFAPHRLSLVRETDGKVEEIPLYSFPMALGVFRGSWGANYTFYGDLFAYTSEIRGISFNITALSFDDRRQFDFGIEWDYWSCSSTGNADINAVEYSRVFENIGNDQEWFNRIHLRMTTACRNITISGPQNTFKCAVRDTVIFDEPHQMTALDLDFDSSGKLVLVNGATNGTAIKGCDLQT